MFANNFFFFKWFSHNILRGRLFLQQPDKCNNIIPSQIKPTRIQKNSLSSSFPPVFPSFYNKNSSSTGTITVFASHLYPLPPFAGQCGQKQFVSPKHST